MPAEEHVRLPDGLFLLESLPSSMLALGIAYQSLPARESEAGREHAALQASQSPSTCATRKCRPPECHAARRSYS